MKNSSHRITRPIQYVSSLLVIIHLLVYFLLERTDIHFQLAGSISIYIICLQISGKSQVLTWITALFSVLTPMVFLASSLFTRSVISFIALVTFFPEGLFYLITGAILFVKAFKQFLNEA